MDSLFLLKFMGAFLGAFVLFYVWVLFRYGYWKRRNIFSPPAKFPVGHMEGAYQEIPMSFRFYELYEKYKHYPFTGIFFFFCKAIIVNDLDMVKNVLLKDYHYFQGHGFKLNKEVDPLSQHIFNLEGEEWKKIRVKLTPTFTSSKMKFMYGTIQECVDEMIIHLKEYVKKKPTVDMKEAIARLGTDIIASCAFGIQTNSFKHPEAEFRMMGKKVFQMTIPTAIVDILSLMTPGLMQRIKYPRFSPELTKFFQKTVRETIEYREKNNVRRSDFLQILIDMKNSGDEASRWSMEEITAQVFVFFVAAFETSSAAVSYGLLELAKNPELRDRIVAQVDATFDENDGVISYETLMGMNFLTQVVDETLRLYPPIPMLMRTCTSNYNVPGTSMVIEKGTMVIIPSLGIHRDPDLYPDPTKFDPERFSPENVQNRHPFAHIPFGEGPRICIGNRFGMMQVKLALTMLLRNFHFELSDKTQLPIQYDRKAFLLHTVGPLALKLTARKDL